MYNNFNYFFLYNIIVIALFIVNKIFAKIVNKIEKTENRTRKTEKGTRKEMENE